MLAAIDRLLNSFTMYKVILYGLCAFLVVALGLSSAGKVSISAEGLAISIITLSIVCYAVNQSFSKALKIPTNSESWLITALILCCILPPSTNIRHIVYIALAGAVAMASKYVVVFRGRHIFNPAAFGAFVMSMAGLLSATWWIATPWLTPFTVLLGLIVLRKQRQLQLFVAFAVAAVAMLVLTSSILQGVAIGSVLRGAALSWPIIFFGSIMLSEPSTLPATRYYQSLLAVIVGLLFTSQLHAGRLSTTPETVLVFGNLLVLAAVPAFGAMVKLTQAKQLSPNIYELIFVKPRRLQFAAGQYVEWTLPHPGADVRGNRRSFSLASAPTEDEVRLAFRFFEKGSSFKTALQAMQLGDQIRIAHVAGNFTLPQNKHQPLLFIAGGIGITPFRSMVTEAQGQRDIQLLYLSSDPEDFIYKADFADIKVSYISQRLTTDELRNFVPDLAERTVYISGPDAMVRGYTKLLKELGVRRTSIKTDNFSGY